MKKFLPWQRLRYSSPSLRLSGRARHSRRRRRGLPYFALRASKDKSGHVLRSLGEGESASYGGQAGFSLIELSIVLLLIALLVTLSGVQTSFLDRMVLRSELEQLYTTCSYLQRSAIAHNKPQYLTFDIQNNRYYYHQTEHALPARLRFGAAPGVKGPPSNPEHTISNPISFKDHNITFHPDGVIEPGAIYITDNKQQYTYALSCAVAQVSYLRKYQYTGQWISL